jgi:hypothetical protein
VLGAIVECDCVCVCVRKVRGEEGREQKERSFCGGAPVRGTDAAPQLRPKSATQSPLSAHVRLTIPSPHASEGGARQPVWLHWSPPVLRIWRSPWCPNPTSVRSARSTRPTDSIPAIVSYLMGYDHPPIVISGWVPIGISGWVDPPEGRRCAPPHHGARAQQGGDFPPSTEAQVWIVTSNSHVHCRNARE